MNVEQARRVAAADPQQTPAHTAAADDDVFLDGFKSLFRDAPYYSTGRDWSDYEPAYRLGRQLFERHRLARIEELDTGLDAEWESARGKSRMAWVEARGAVEHAWIQARASAPHPPASGAEEAA